MQIYICRPTTSKISQKEARFDYEIVRQPIHYQGGEHRLIGETFKKIECLNLRLNQKSSQKLCLIFISYCLLITPSVPQ